MSVRPTGTGSHLEQLKQFTVIADTGDFEAKGIRKFSADIVKLEILIQSMLD